VDQEGAIYVVGRTSSRSFPTTPGSYDPTFNEGPFDGFLTKLSGRDLRIVYSTYLGGSGDDYPRQVAVGADGSAYVVGSTLSSDFPTSPDAFDSTPNGGLEAFALSIDPSGSSLGYGTYLGGATFDTAWGVAVDKEGYAYVSGWTQSADYPSTPGAFDSTFNGKWDGVLTKLGVDGSTLAYSAFLGGHGEDLARAVAVDQTGSAYVTGRTAGGHFPVTTAAYDRSFNGRRDVFVTQVDPTGGTLGYSTLLGGAEFEEGMAIQLDRRKDVIVTGTTTSRGFPTTVNAWDTARAGKSDAFVSRISSRGARLGYSTYLGGSSWEFGVGLSADADGAMWVSGTTFSADFPSTLDAFDGSFNGFSDAYLVGIPASGDSLLYATFLGGASRDTLFNSAPSRTGQVVLVGETESGDYPTTPDAFGDHYRGNIDGIVSVFSTP
jgi:hypothetical protein